MPSKVAPPFRRDWMRATWAYGCGACAALRSACGERALRQRWVALLCCKRAVLCCAVLQHVGACLGVPAAPQLAGHTGLDWAHALAPAEVKKRSGSDQAPWLTRTARSYAVFGCNELRAISENDCAAPVRTPDVTIVAFAPEIPVGLVMMTAKLDCGDSSGGRAHMTLRFGPIPTCSSSDTKRLLPACAS